MPIPEALTLATVPLLWLAAARLLALRPWRLHRLSGRLSPVGEGSLAAGLGLAWLALHGGAPFERAARLAVDRTALPAALRSVDDRIRSVEDLPEQLWQTLREQLDSSAGDATSENPSGQVPNLEAPAEAEPIAKSRVEGPLEGAVAGALRELTAAALRVLAYAAGLALALASALVRRVDLLGRRSRPAEATRPA